MPKDWARAEAWRRIQSTPETYGRTTAGVAVELLTEMIEKYEEPPVDPDILFTRQVVADAYVKLDMHNHAANIRNGKEDNMFSFRLALATIKRVRAAGLPEGGFNG